MPLTRRQIAAMTSLEIETRLALICEASMSPAVYEHASLLQSVLYERMHHEAQLLAIRYARVYARRTLKRWKRRYGLKERTVG